MSLHSLPSTLPAAVFVLILLAEEGGGRSEIATTSLHFTSTRDQGANIQLDVCLISFDETLSLESSFASVLLYFSFLSLLVLTVSWFETESENSRGIIRTISTAYSVDEMYLNTFRKFSVKHTTGLIILCCCKVFNNRVINSDVKSITCCIRVNRSTTQRVF